MRFNQTISSKYSKRNGEDFLSQIVFDYMGLLQTILQRTTLMSYVLTARASMEKGLQNVTQFVQDRDYLENKDLVPRCRTLDVQTVHAGTGYVPCNVHQFASLKDRFTGNKLSGPVQHRSMFTRHTAHRKRANRSLIFGEETCSDSCVKRCSQCVQLYKHFKAQWQLV